MKSLRKLSFLVLALFSLSLFSACGSKKDDEFITSLEQLNSGGYKIGVPEGANAMYSSQEYFDEAEIVYYSSVADAYIALASNKIDAFAFDSPALEYVDRANDDLALLPNSKIDDENIVIGAPFGREDLIDELNSFIKKYREDGTYDEMYDRWVNSIEHTMPEIPVPENPERTIKIATEGMNEPFNYFGDNGELTGFDIEFSKRLAYDLNAEIEFVTMNFAGIIAATETGKVDLLVANLNDNETRREVMLLSDTYVDAEISLIVNSNRLEKSTNEYIPNSYKIPKYKNIEEINISDNKIGVLTGTTFDSYTKEIFDKTEPVYYNTIPDLVLALKSGKIDGFLMDEPISRTISNKEETVTFWEKPILDDSYAFAVSNDPKFDDLQAEIDSYIKEYVSSDRVVELDKKWFGNDEDLKQPCDLDALSGDLIRVAVPSVAEPFSYLKDGNVVGYDVDIIYNFCKDNGYSLEIIQTEMSSVVEGLVSGKYEVIAGCIAVTEERAQSVDFLTPTYTGGVTMVVPSIGNKGLPIYLEYDELSGKTVACMTGTIFFDFADDYLGEGTYEQMYCQDLTSQVEALNSGKADAILIDEPVARLLVSQHTELAMLPDVMAEDQYGIALPKDGELTEKVNEILKEFESDGTLDAMAEKWFSADESIKTMPELDFSGATNGTLRFAHDTVTVPMSYGGDGGDSLGYDAELATRIAHKLGMNIEYIQVNFDSLIPMLVSGKADIACGCMSITEERKKSIDFSISYYKGGVVGVVKAENNAKTSGVPFEIAKHGVMLGSVAEVYIEETYPEAEILTYTSIADAILALNDGKIDYVRTAYSTSLNAIKNNPNLYIMDGYRSNDTSAIAVAKENSDLTKEINEVLEKFESDGTLDEIIANWTTVDKEYNLEARPVAENPVGVLKVAIAADREPMCFVSGDSYQGVDCELIERIAYELGMTVEYQNMQFSSITAAISSGKADVAISNLSPTEERKKSVDFTTSYYDNPQVFLANRSGQEEVVGFTEFLEGVKDSFYKTFIVESRWKLIAEGIVVTLIITILATIFGSVLGFLICLLKLSGKKTLNVISNIYIRLFQGTPIVVILMIFYYIIFGNSDINAIWVAVLGFGMNFAAYTSEMMRTGIEAIDKGQTEAAYAIGFSKVKTFFKIVFPQAAMHFLPVYKGEFVSLLKMTSVVGYIAIQDLTKMSDIIRSRTYEAFFPLIATALIYFVLAYFLTIFITVIQKKINPKSRKRTLKGVEISK